MKKLANAEFEMENNQLNIYISGEIDHHSALSLKDIIDGQILRRSPAVAVMNFEKVTFMDSSGIGLILARYKFCQNCGTSLYVQGVSRQTQRILGLAGIKTIQEIANQEKV